MSTGAARLRGQSHRPNQCKVKDSAPAQFASAATLNLDTRRS
jgi:hypothetical protein